MVQGSRLSNARRLDCGRRIDIDSRTHRDTHALNDINWLGKGHLCTRVIVRDGENALVGQERIDRIAISHRLTRANRRLHHEQRLSSLIS